MGDGLVNGQLWIYSYVPVADMSKINPFYLELTTGFQENVYIKKNKLIIPYGSQGLFDEYAYFDGRFHQGTN
jgi:hypothetical protein